MASPSIRILVAEDNSADAELQVRELKRAGFRTSHLTVDSSRAYTAAIADFGPDIILSDFSMPAFDGMEALRLALELAPDTPFIFVSGTLGEDYAIRALKDGAADYVLKSNLVRLPAAVERALSEAKLKRARRRAEAALSRAQAMAKLAHVVTGPDGAFEESSASLAELAGEGASMPSTTRQWLSMVHPEDAEACLKMVEAAQSGQRVEMDYRFRRRDGAWIHVRQVIEPLEMRSGAKPGERWFSTLQDVTVQKEAEDRIRRLNRVHAVLSGINSLMARVPSREELFREACRIAVDAGQLRMAWIGVYDKDAQKIEPMAWHGHEEGFLGLMALSVNGPVVEGRGLVRRAIRERQPVIINDVEVDTRFRLRKEAFGRGYRAGVVIPLVRGEEVLGVFGLFAGQAHFFDDEEMRLLSQLAGDIAFALDHIAKVEHLQHLAYYDPATGLANRTLFQERLSQHLKSAAGLNNKLALIVANIERFRAVNESLGRQAGDSVLTQLAQRLSAALSDATRVARLGADDFVFIVPGVRSELDTARILGDLAQQCFSEPFHVSGQELLLSAKAGIALFPTDGTDAETLLRNAEAALKKCKLRRERHLFFEEEMTRRVAEDLGLESQLRRALEREEFVLHYQPRVELKSRRVTGLEALIRWESSDGLVPPIKFIPLLEQTGLILEVGAWALRQAMLQHKRWLETGLAAPRIAVNVSSVQLRQKDFVSRVKRVVDMGAQPPGIDIEITESMLMEDVDGSIRKLSRIRDLGLGIAIDDFGTGYSSLAYLARLPVTSLKIDRSFIITMIDDPAAMTLVSTMVSLAHSLKLKVVAEGVDAEEQAAVLEQLGCDELQGYLYSRPLPADQMTAKLGLG